MKKYLFILAGLLYLLGQGEAEARAVKLGRSTGSGTASGYQQVFDGGTSGGTHATFCPANCASCNGSSCSKCKSGYYLKNGGCQACPANATCSGTETITCNTGFHRSATGTTCTECSDITVANGTCTACQAVGNTCTNVSCYYGYVKSGTTCSAISFSGMSCVSGYRKVVSSDRACCVPMCQGVSCVSGYTPTATSTGCCCQANTTPTTCGGPMQVYHPTLKKCVEAVCPSNCADMCTQGYCASCNPGYELNSNGRCSSICTSSQIYNTKIGKCVSAVCPIHCADDCTHGCQSCEIGYTLNYTTGMCDEQTIVLPKKPISSDDACDGTSSTPRFCDNGLIRVEGRGCCPSDYASKPGYACYQCAIR